MYIKNDHLFNTFEQMSLVPLIKTCLYVFMGGFSTVAAYTYQDTYTGAFLGLAVFSFVCWISCGVDCEEESYEIDSLRFIYMVKFFLIAGFISALITLFL